MSLKLILYFHFYIENKNIHIFINVRNQIKMSDINISFNKIY